mmetsp:Transcript_19045/g.54092  ORF Transcript_19045/g.54092 Transcript_19045/m.54092 type:complete len:507 (+) Transcript_19045:3649-5169(+)
MRQVEDVDAFGADDVGICRLRVAESDLEFVHELVPEEGLHVLEGGETEDALRADLAALKVVDGTPVLRAADAQEWVLREEDAEGCADGLVWIGEEVLFLGVRPCVLVLLQPLQDGIDVKLGGAQPAADGVRFIFNVAEGVDLLGYFRRPLSHLADESLTKLQFVCRERSRKSANGNDDSWILQALLVLQCWPSDDSEKAFGGTSVLTRVCVDELVVIVVVVFLTFGYGGDCNGVSVAVNAISIVVVNIVLLLIMLVDDPHGIVDGQERGRFLERDVRLGGRLMRQKDDGVLVVRQHVLLGVEEVHGVVVVGWPAVAAHLRGGILEFVDVADDGDGVGSTGGVVGVAAVPYPLGQPHGGSLAPPVLAIARSAAAAAAGHGALLVHEVVVELVLPLFREWLLVVTRGGGLGGGRRGSPGAEESSVGIGVGVGVADCAVDGGSLLGDVAVAAARFRRAVGGGAVHLGAVLVRPCGSRPVALDGRGRRGGGGCCCGCGGGSRGGEGGGRR